MDFANEGDLSVKKEIILEKNQETLQCQDSHQRRDYLESCLLAPRRIEQTTLI